MTAKRVQLPPMSPISPDAKTGETIVVLFDTGGGVRWIESAKYVEESDFGGPAWLSTSGAYYPEQFANAWRPVEPK